MARYFTPPSPVVLNAIFVRRGDASERERTVKGIQCGRGPDDTIISVSGNFGKIEPYTYSEFSRLFDFRRHRLRRSA